MGRDTVQYAERKAWYQKNNGLTLFGRWYVRFGLPTSPDTSTRQYQPSRFRHAGNYDGVPVYVERSEPASSPRFIYVLVDAGCRFQVYAEGREVQ